MNNEIIKITDFSDERLDMYARLSEAQLRHLYEPDLGIMVVESPRVILTALDAGYKPVSLLTETQALDHPGDMQKVLERLEGAPVFAARDEILTRLTGFHLTRGALCAMRRPLMPTPEQICRDARRIVVLERVMNPTNIGAIFRSAAALGMDAVLLTPGCSDPFYRRAIRVSMGTVFQIPWTYIGESWESWQKEGMSWLHEMGFKTAAMALSDQSVGLGDPDLNSERRLALVMGTEGDGLADLTIADCDYTVKIPMSHGVDSLNVAAASAVAFWQLGHHE